MSATRLSGPRHTLACAALVAIAALACKLNREERSSTTGPALPTPGVELPSNPLTDPPTSGGAVAPSDGDMFAGAPAADVKFMRVITLRANGVFMRAPVGWTGDAEHYDGLVQIFPKDESAVVMVNLMNSKVGDATIALWTKSVGGRDVTYDAAFEGKLGKDSLPGQMAKGSGKLNRKQAEFWRFVVPVGSGTNMLVIGAVQADATPEHRAEFIACMRSIYKV
jgi:hypothetical protein